MDSKLERFLNAVNFNKDFTSYFDKAVVKDVRINKETNRMTLILNLDKLIPINVFEELYNKGKTLKGASEVRYKFIINNIDNEYFKDYFNYYFDILLSRCPMLEAIDKNKITFNDNNINFEVLNNVEKDKIDSLKEKIEIFLTDMGFNDVSVTSNINEELRKEFIDTLGKEEKEPEKKETIKLLKGKNIKGEVSNIKNLITNENNVILIANVFGIDSKSTQSGWYIITLKITDNTDSIFANIFTKEKEEFDYLLSNIKEGKWYKFRGSVKLNTRSNDYEYGINDIETFDVKETKLVDDAEVKRDGEIITIRLTGNGFLYNMVRIIAGTLLKKLNL